MRQIYNPFSTLTLAAALFALGSAGHAQTSPQRELVAPDAIPLFICVTNACSKREDKIATVGDAVQAGDALAVKALGGSTDDVLAALTVKVELEAARRFPNDPEKRERWAASERKDYAHYTDPSLGAFEFTGIGVIGMADGDGFPKAGGGVNRALFIIRRYSASGCMEAVIVHEDGQGIPTDQMCTK